MELILTKYYFAYIQYFQGFLNFSIRILQVSRSLTLSIIKIKYPRLRDSGCLHLGQRALGAEPLLCLTCNSTINLQHSHKGQPRRLSWLLCTAWQGRGRWRWQRRGKWCCSVIFELYLNVRLKPVPVPVPHTPTPQPRPPQHWQINREAERQREIARRGRVRTAVERKERKKKSAPIVN